MTHKPAILGKSNEMYTDNHTVKIWTITYLLHQRIVQLESCAEIIKTKSSLDVLKTKNGKVSKRGLHSRLLEELCVFGFVCELLLLYPESVVVFAVGLDLPGMLILSQNG